MLGRVGQCFGDNVVGADLNLIGQPFLDAQVELNRNRRAAGHRPQRLTQTALGQNRRMDAARQIAQFLQARSRACSTAWPSRIRSSPVLRRHLRLRHTKLQRQRHQPLLSAVMQVSLDLAAGLIGGGNDPRA